MLWVFIKVIKENYPDALYFIGEIQLSTYNQRIPALIFVGLRIVEEMRGFQLQETLTTVAASLRSVRGRKDTWVNV